jgi:fibronectin type 3 domain-containing protein
MKVCFPLVLRVASRFFFGAAFFAVTICASASETVELSWTASPSANIAGYKVYFGTQPGVYTASVYFSNITDVIIPGLNGGQIYYFAVSAVDTNGYESDLSNEADYTVPLPAGLGVQAQGTTQAMRAVAVAWTPSPASDVYGYNVYYGTQSGVYTGSAMFYYTTNGIIPGLTAGATYYFAVSALDSYGDSGIISGEAACVVPVPATLALHAQMPTNLTGVELSWNPDTTDGVTSYNIYYGTQSGFYTDSTSYGAANDVVIHGLEIGQTYYFAVTAVDAYGNESDLSNEASSAVPTPKPLLLQAHGTTDAMNAVQLSWSASPNSDVYGYNVHYGLQSGDYTNVAGFYYATNGMIAGLAGGVKYYFSVSPIDSYGDEGVLSSEVAYTVPAPPALVLHAKVATNASGVELTWAGGPTNGVTGYNVYYGTQSGDYPNGASYDRTVNDTVIKGLNGGQTYYFTVAASDAYGNQSALSSVAAVVAPLPKPMKLQTQTYTDGNGQPYLIEVRSPSAVNGSWEMDYSTDMQNWSYYTSGWGSGNGDGYDVDVYVSVDATVSQVFFRVINF